MKLKAGVAGAGVFGGYHAGKYADASDAELVGILDPDTARVSAAADKFGCAAYEDPAVFFEAIDVCTIAAPATYHYALAKQALAAGVHCLVEKPIAMQLDHADELIALAKAQGLVLQIGHQERYVFDAFGLLSRPAPKEIHSRRLNSFSGRAMDVSVTYDLMIHDLDLLSQIVNAPLIQVKTEADRQHGNKWDKVKTWLTFSDGTRAVLAASRLEDSPTRDMRLVYEDGEIVVNFLTKEITNTTATPLAQDFSGDVPAFKDSLGLGTQLFLQSVITAQPPIVTGQDGRAALNFALRIEDAI